jgi:hypothetical protein
MILNNFADIFFFFFENEMSVSGIDRALVHAAISQDRAPASDNAWSAQPTMGAAATAAVAGERADAQSTSTFRISVVAMTGATTDIDDASAADTIMSVKQRVFAANPTMSVHRQRLVFRPGPHGIDPLADDETLGGAGVAQDGTGVLDVLMVGLTGAEAVELGSRLLGAAQNGRASDLLSLLDRGADIDFQDSSQRTALIWAAANGHASCVRHLLAGGADKDIRDVNGCTALIRATAKDHTGSLRLLLEAGADVEARDLYGRTALIYAAEVGHTYCARLLVNAGADKGIKGDDGNTALIRAAEMGRASCVRLLIDSGADLHAVNRDGCTALVRATQSGYTECARLLEDVGADI